MKKQRKSSAPVNFSVIAPDNGTEAEILIYGIIGEDWWQEDEDKQNTDENLALALANLGERYATVNVRLNSPGGDVMHGLAIINAMKRCKAKVVTWNDGLAASMASAIWMAGTERHMAKNALLMVHSPLSFTWGNAVEHREAADTLDTWESGLVGQMAEATGMKPEEIKAAYFDGKDHWLSFDQCATLGLCPMPEKPEETYQAANVLNVQGRTIEELYAIYRERSAEPAAQKPNMMARIRALFGLDAANEPSATETTNHSPSIIELDMTKEELTAALVDALAAHEAAKAAATPAPAAQAGEGDDDPLKKMEARLAAAEAKNAALEAKITDLGSQPGAKPAAGALPEGTPESTDDTIKAFHAELVRTYESGAAFKIAD